MKDIQKYTVNRIDSLETAIKKMYASNVSILFVTDNDFLCGFITKEQILIHLSEYGSLKDLVCTLKIKACDVAQHQGEQNDNQLQSSNPIPVIDDQKKLVGIKDPFASEMYFKELQREDIESVSDFFDHLGGEGNAFFNKNEINRIRVLNHLTQKHDDNDDNEIHWGVFEKKHEMIGYIALLELDKMLPWVGLALRERHKGQHLGRKMLAFAESYAEQHGYGGLMLSTSFANIRGQNLYYKMGFINYGVRISKEFLFVKRFSKKAKHRKE